MRLARFLLALTVALAAFAPAHAGGGGGSSGPSNRIQANFTLDGPDDHEADDHEADDGHGEPSSADNPRTIDLPTIALPAFDDRRLATYLFISVRLLAADGVDVWRLRERTHFMRDAIIRAGHRRSVARADDPMQLDDEAARGLLNEALVEVLGEGIIARIDIINVEARRGPSG